MDKSYCVEIDCLRTKDFREIFYFSIFLFLFYFISIDSTEMNNIINAIVMMNRSNHFCNQLLNVIVVIVIINQLIIVNINY